MSAADPIDLGKDADSARIVVTYRIDPGIGVEPQAVAEAIRTEQTIEFPFDLAPAWIQNEVVGRIEDIDQQVVRISYPLGVTGGGLVQFLNVLWGNVSLLNGVRIIDLQLPTTFLAGFSGPRFGISGVRSIFNAPRRPLLCTALKPMGLSPEELGATAVTLARAGFDMIKDDHGLASQPWAPWAKRVHTISSLVCEIDASSDHHSVYMPALNVPADQLVDAAHQAKEWGAGALLVLPGLTGFDSLRMLAEDSELNLPIMSHPSFLGSTVVNPQQGINHGIVFGTIMRLAGADISIFPNYGGRFSFSQQQCEEIAQACVAPLSGIAPI
ncbi:MAG: ribulose 1,5-bisphosphate carboxylase large subunit, partial [Actinobacteria bacterium]|nr:ribulose 1,5-bisphosphate carboxylase large subunit [Actinomycetota bacterium]